MVVGVVAHDVPLRRHAADDVRCRFDHIAHYEEGGGGIVLFQRVQNGFRVAVFIAAVKGQVNDLLAGVTQIPGVVLGQILHGGVANRRLPLHGKGQPPVVGGGGDGGGSRGGKRIVLAGYLPDQQGADQHKGCRPQCAG